MQLDQLFGDRQSQAQATVLARRTGIGLTKPVEDMRQKFGSDADTTVLNDDFDAVIRLLCSR